MKMKPGIRAVLTCACISMIAMGCDKSRLKTDESITSASVAVMFDGSLDRPIPNQTAQEILPALAKATHQYHSGSPHPRLKYRLRIEQKGLVEDFYFLDDYDLISCTLPSPEKAKVSEWIRMNVERINANKVPEDTARKLADPQH